MGWESTEWACGHQGSMQLYGKMSGRDARVAYEAGKDCLACWLIGQWDTKTDPRGKRADRFSLAVKIAEGKGIRIRGEEIKPQEMVETEEYPSFCTA